ncbi:nicotinamide/nicotinate mononucleotide adenylyltransferase [Fadolivirus algeromassiliense]|jgi:nicotinic acid mononucleotide adenylyltransferase|uniref:Nicotinamide/nicotinate mononucleotide adenylyltransferase n=1 Tax=Fadolivirus FV1/VV64 TaxID=3070911 RepID=A0A7D3QWQ1_9VIRU|nr:nicotinamide/nicotinate mononucleotide adenylyltransferase [Fadolivirus algeromassiliense]QKF94766.1 nicotinamide/nicotinate mononucleotide adenylyltransferase [Fadolivirus FV1/VV64]
MGQKHSTTSLSGTRVEISDGLPLGQLKEYFNSKPPASNGNKVIIYTGGMTPIHKGHVAMICRAKQVFEADGYNVCVIVCPTWSDYVKGKLGDITPHKALFENDNALQLVARALSCMDGVFVCKYDYMCWRDYPQTMTDAMTEIKSTPGLESAMVDYLTGQDNAVGMYKHGQLTLTGTTFGGKVWSDGLIVARRTHDKDNDIVEKLNQFSWIKWIDMPEETLTISSTKIRTLLASGQSVQNQVPDNIVNDVHKLYKIKN